MGIDNSGHKVKMSATATEYKTQTIYTTHSCIIIKMNVLWNVQPCSVAETDRRFRDRYVFYLFIVYLTTLFQQI
jgi:hypothetical protein